MGEDPMEKITFGMCLKIAMILADVAPKELSSITGISISRIYEYTGDKALPPTDRYFEIVMALEERRPGVSHILSANDH